MNGVSCHIFIHVPGVIGRCNDINDPSLRFARTASYLEYLSKPASLLDITIRQDFPLLKTDIKDLSPIPHPRKLERWGEARVLVDLLIPNMDTLSPNFNVAAKIVHSNKLDWRYFQQPSNFVQVVFLKEALNYQKENANLAWNICTALATKALEENGGYISTSQNKNEVKYVEKTQAANLCWDALCIANPGLQDQFPSTYYY